MKLNSRQKSLLKQYQTLFEMAQNGMVIEDRHGVILDANPSYCKFMGYRREELIGKSIHILAPDDKHAEVDDNIKRILAGEKLHHLIQAVGKDGKERHLELFEERISENPDDGFVLIVNDISDKMRAESLDEIIREQNEELKEKNSTLRHTVQELSERQRVMNMELSLAQEVQQHFLPNDFPFADRLSFAGHYNAHSKIGGDLYDAFAINSNTVGFYIADVSGHGVSAALLTAVLKFSIQRFREFYDDESGSLYRRLENDQALSLFMNDINYHVMQAMHRGSFITFLLGVLNLENGSLMLANAGHQLPILWEAKKKEAGEIKVPPNIAFGIQQDFRYQITQTKIEQGDKLLIYTDGVTDQLNDSDEQFDIPRLINSVYCYGKNSAPAMLSAIVNDLQIFSNGTDADDDQSLLILDLLEK